MTRHIIHTSSLVSGNAFIRISITMLSYFMNSYPGKMTLLSIGGDMGIAVSVLVRVCMFVCLLHFWSSRAFVNKPLIRLSSDFAGELIVAFLDLALLHLIHTVSRPLICRAFSVISLVKQFPRICSQTADRIEFKFWGEPHPYPPPPHTLI